MVGAGCTQNTLPDYNKVVTNEGGIPFQSGSRVGVYILLQYMHNFKSCLKVLCCKLDPLNWICWMHILALQKYIEFFSLLDQIARNV